MLRRRDELAQRAVCSNERAIGPSGNGLRVRLWRGCRLHVRRLRYENEDIQLSRTGLDTFARIISAEHHTGIVFAL
jgi:hypothetical protein